MTELKALVLRTCVTASISLYVVETQYSTNSGSSAWFTTYHEMALHYGVAVMPARPYKPRDKYMLKRDAHFTPTPE